MVFDHVAEPACGEAILAATHAGTERALNELQAILGEARLSETAVAWLTRGAVATGPEDGAAGLSRAPLWGLVRSARAEHPERRLQLVDVDGSLSEAGLLAKLLSAVVEPELALRHGSAVAPRLVRAGSGTLGVPAGMENYRVAVSHPGRLDGVSVVAAPELLDPLAPGHVRVGVRAAGMNFRDVLVALGEIGSPGIGFEFAGVVEAVGAGVTSVSVGDRVFGCGLGCFGTRAVTPVHLVAKVPGGMSFEAAATVPLAYLTALYALQDLGQVKAGERVLVHAAAGGMGMAAVQLCAALWGGGVWDGEPGQVVGAGRDGIGCEAHREFARPELRDDIPGGDGWRGRGCRAQLADGRVRRRVAAASAARRAFFGDGERRHAGSGLIAERYRGVRYQAFVLSELMQKIPSGCRRCWSSWWRCSRGAS